MSVDETFGLSGSGGAGRPEIDLVTGAQRLCGVYRLRLRCVGSGFIRVQSLVFRGRRPVLGARS